MDDEIEKRTMKLDWDDLFFEGMCQKILKQILELQEVVKIAIVHFLTKT